MNVDAPVKSKAEIRRDNVSLLKKHHEPVFKALGIVDPYFDAKARNMYPPVGKIGFFPSQLENESDIYFEVAGFKQEIVDPQRTLYRLRNNPHYKSEEGMYEYKADTPAGPLYFVSLDDCEVIRMPEKKTSKQVEEVLSLSEETHEGDDHLAEKLTMRDYAAIHLRTPNSSKEWLNKMITSSKK